MQLKKYNIWNLDLIGLVRLLVIPQIKLEENIAKENKKITGFDTFTGKKYENLVQIFHKVNIPSYIKRSELTPIYASPNGYLILMINKFLPDKILNYLMILNKV